jgi:hypothetical protein
VPVITADCGDPVALSATEIAALRLAAVVGVNVTVMVHVPPAAREAPQLFVCPKLLAFVPVTEMPVMVSGAVPGFDSVIGNAVAAVPTSVFGNASGFGLSVACGCVPAPVITALCGEPVALSATEIAALRLAAVVGVNVTEIVQVPPAASEPPQLFVCPKLLALVPVTEMPLMVSGAVPGFDSVIGNAAAAIPTSVFGNASGLGLNVACGAAAGVPVPVTVKLTGWFAPPPLLASEKLIVAEYDCAKVGVNVTLSWQLAPTMRLLVQVPPVTVNAGLVEAKPPLMPAE